MLQHRDHDDEGAVDVMVGEEQYWIRFFAALRMKAIWAPALRARSFGRRIGHLKSGGRAAAFQNVLRRRASISVRGIQLAGGARPATAERSSCSLNSRRASSTTTVPTVLH
jgi:hypothetical protein